MLVLLGVVPNHLHEGVVGVADLATRAPASHSLDAVVLRAHVEVFHFSRVVIIVHPLIRKLAQAAMLEMFPRPWSFDTEFDFCILFTFCL